MSGTATKRMIDVYMEAAPLPNFLSGFFQSPQRNFHDTETVVLDVVRDTEEIAVVIQDLSVGARPNESSLFTSKEFTPPIYDEKGEISAFKMIKRQPGVDPFQNPDFGANAMAAAFQIFHRIDAKIRRAVELQAAQVLQTGKLTLVDKNGASAFALDFQPKSTHFPTVGADWSLTGSTGSPLADISALADLIRRDGKTVPTQLIFGKGAMQRFLANADVRELLEKSRLVMGTMAPAARGAGASYRGRIWIDYYEYELWMYDGYYKHPQTGTLTPYVADDHVIMLSKDGRLDLSFGSIPMFIPPDRRELPQFIPTMLNSSEKGLALTTNAWVTEDGKNLMVSAGTRPLTIPTAIDSFGCLDVVA